MAWAVKHLPPKCKALSSNFSNAKKPQKKRAMTSTSVIINYTGSANDNL
jgi:hypothetical protein